MKKCWIISMVVSGCILWGFSGIMKAQRQMEMLDRGVVAMKSGTNVIISWRIFGDEYYNTSYNIYRGSTKLNQSPVTGPSFFIDTLRIYDSSYTVSAIVNGAEQPLSSPVPVWGQNYIDIPLQIPAGVTTPDNYTCSYSANDCSVGDLDGDGQYEIILKWDPSNSKDNSQSGYTGNVYLDAYELDGTRLWRIDLGINIRAGAHYTQFMVYDLDGDGKAEVACKTAPGTRDASGNYLTLGPASGADHEADYRNTSGYILSGPEYFTIFNGETGIELATDEYDPPRGSLSSWGDTYGNRVDRFLACIAYLDGVRPSVVMCRGYYTGNSGTRGRTVLAAWDYRDDALTKRWTFSADRTADYPDYTGQGNHNLSVADVDDDGKDEIIYGACAIDDDGTGLWTTGLGHGDAMHVSDIYPERPGLEKWGIHEGDGSPGSALLDARTGQIIWKTGNDDVGRGVSADLTSSFSGMECWGGTNGLRSCRNAYAGTGPSSSNHVIWWDGNDQRELLDGTSISRYNAGTLLNASGCSSNNGTKSNPCLQADIFGDWREEVIFRKSDNSALRLFVTTYSTSRRMYTLMHDPVYRLGIAWQNVAYNQPPHTGFYFGNGREAPPPPVSSGQLKWNAGQTWDIQASENWTVNGNPAFFNQGDDVLFDVSGSNATPIALTDTLKPSMVTVYATTDYILNGSGTLSGSMQLIKAGSGVLAIDTDNDYTGITSVWGGELLFNGILSQSHIVVNNFSGIGGRGTLSKGVSMPYGGNVIVGSHGEADTLKIFDSLYIGGTSQLYFDLSDDTSGLSKTNDILLVNGDMMLKGKTTININMPDNRLGVGQYTLIECTDTLYVSTDNIQMEGLLGVPYEIIKTDSSLILEAFYVRPNATIFWKGDQSDLWDQVNSYNWLNADTTDWFVQNDTVIFDDSGSSATTIQMANPLPVGAMLVNSTIDYTFEGNGYISGEGKLIKTGTGTLTLSVPNLFTGGTSVDDGILMINNSTGSATGSGAVQVNAGAVLTGNGMVEGLVSVNNGGTLSGEGIFNGPVNLKEGATIAPGYDSIGNLTVNNDLTFMSGSTYKIDVNTQNYTSDRIQVTGQLALDGTLELTEINNADFLVYTVFRIFEASGFTGMFSDILPESPGEDLKWDTTMLRSHGYIRVMPLTAVHETELEDIVSVYPNPAGGHVTIHFSEIPHKAVIELRDLKGSVISASVEKYPENAVMDLSGVVPGVYIIRIRSDHHTIVRKIIRN
jgi:rhamnogalacturonan endolyase